MLAAGKPPFVATWISPQGCFATWQPSFPRESKGEHPEWKPLSFYSWIPEVTSHHMYHIPFPRNKSVSSAHKPTWKGWGTYRNTNTRGWGSYNFLVVCFLLSWFRFSWNQALKREFNDKSFIWEMISGNFGSKWGCEIRRARIPKRKCFQASYLKTFLPGSWSSVLLELWKAVKNKPSCYHNQGSGKLEYSSALSRSVIG